MLLWILSLLGIINREFDEEFSILLVKPAQRESEG